MLALPAAASARLQELGQLGADARPSCPAAPCNALTRTTAIQAKVGDARGPLVAPRNGRLVAWTVRLGKLGPSQIKFFDEHYGGKAQAQITVLRQGKSLRFRATGQSAPVELEPYFGKTAQFPLGRSLTVKKGYVIALTVPTWAPVLSLGLDKLTSWRASRPREGCADTVTETAQIELGALAQYYCLYRGGRITYSATLISTP